ncbi:MAG: bifunctional acetate--CoA ligase family protein/GNAT family N-acetyltransferase [Pseudomonadota bacterium]
MSIRHLETLFSPRSVAVVGATDRAGSIGRIVIEQIAAGGFEGTVWPINPKHTEIAGLKAYADPAALPGAPDLAVVTTPARTVSGVIDALGQAGCRAAVVISDGLEPGSPQVSEMLQAATDHGLRLIGPDCVGIIRPCRQLNASLVERMPLSGQLAFLSQSGAIVGGVVDWAHRQGIGFSHVVSLGDQADVGVADLLDYLAADVESRAVLLYVESIADAAAFMSAARACARVKPVIALKAGRHRTAPRSAQSHTGAMAGTDALFDAAFERAGILRITNLEELFDAAEVLDHSGSRKPLRGDRLGIVTNGGGLGLLAADALADKPVSQGGTLAALSPDTLTALDEALPPDWSRTNPADIIGDAPPERYAATTAAMLADPGVDAVLALHSPTALVSSTDAAQAVIDAVKAHRRGRPHPKPVFANWLGEQAADSARAALEGADIPSFKTPAEAVRAFGYLVRRRRLLEKLSRVPPSQPAGMVPDWAAARRPIEAAAARGTRLLNEAEAKAVLAAAGIPTVRTAPAATPEEARLLAEGMAAEGIRRFALKILSDDIPHKSDYGGVVLDIEGPEEMEAAATRMLAEVARRAPHARISGLSVQEMRRVKNAHELICGISDDPVFGPAILFGRGGTAVEVVNDKALGLPPLDMALAEDLIDATRISRLLAGYRQRAAANRHAIASVLVRLAEMARALPMITELDINPLLADEHGAVALDARIVISRSRMDAPVPNPRLAIRPYPVELEGMLSLRDGSAVFCRPVKPEDAGLFEEFFASADPRDLRMRFFSTMRTVPPAMIASLTQIDYARAIAFMAIDPTDGRMMGIGRLAIDANMERAEYAIMVRSDLQGLGLGYALMNRLIDYGHETGLSEIWGDILSENAGMLRMVQKLGFTLHPDREEGIVHVSLLLNPAQQGQNKPQRQGVPAQ